MAKSTKELIKSFYHIQEERIKTYKEFDGIFDTYLASGPNYNFKWYRNGTDFITKSFAKLSNDVKDIETALLSRNEREASSILRKIQLKEKEKLEEVARFQISKQAAHSEGNKIVESTRDSSARLRKIHSEICELMEELKYETEEAMQAEDDLED